MVNILCENCLEDEASAVPVGNTKGSQRDPYTEVVQLCPPCSGALLRSDFFTLHSRFTLERRITNGRKKE